MTPDSLDGLNARLLQFARDRDWEQFHSPKNLAMALAGECGELLEHFQWLSEAQSSSLPPAKRREVAAELADILLTRGIQRYDFSPGRRDALKMYLDRVEKYDFNEHAKIEAADFLKSKKDKTLDIVKRAEQLAQMLLEQHPEFILCHSDIHGYNLLNGNNGVLYIVDWDALIFAPKERDLMFIGGGHGDSGYAPQGEEKMFYRGYGSTTINRIAIAYYRYERIIIDMVDDCDSFFYRANKRKIGQQHLSELFQWHLPQLFIERHHEMLRDSLAQNLDDPLLE